MTEEEATRSAEASGQPVEVTSLTDERTLVMAQPEGHFEATMSAGVARVRDGREGWRTPSARLVPGAGGALRPEAALSSIVVSGGGSGPLMSVGDGEHKVELGWPSALPAPIVEDSTATFPEVMAGVDLVVRAGIESAETFLVVKTPAAAANPNVRTALFGFSAPGLTVRELGNGARSLVDGRGVERFMIPEARMWDSSGKVPGLKRAADVVEESAEARSARVDVGVTANRLTLAADNSLLDDPETVFPVVIDPEVSLSQSYVVRVTESFRQVNDMDKDGKIGYNGWSSENGGYYKSRMFYQFRWPTSSSKQQILTGSQIIKADFRYLQRHSPQHACNTSYGPGVRVRLYNTIGADTTWPGPSAHSWSPVTTSLAVGSESEGCAAKWQTWTITAMMRAERNHASHKTRTTVTVGVYSADESDKRGWRHYDNSPGPELKVAYDPVALGATMTIAGSVAGPPWVTTSAAPSLSPKVNLATSGLTCDGATCLRGRVTITGPGLPGTPGAWATTSASTLTVPAPVTGLQDGKSYTVKVEGEETRSGRSVTKTFSFWSDQRAGTAPTEVAFAPYAGGTWETGGISDTLTPLLRARFGLPSGATCLELTNCLAPTFKVVDNVTNATVWQSTPSAVAPNVVSQVQVPASAGLIDNRTYRVEVSSRKTTNLLTSATSTMTFTAGLRPGATTITAPVTTASLPVTVTFTNATPVAKYQWEAACSSGGPQSTGETTSTNTDVDMPGCAVALLIRARGISASGLEGAWSPWSTITIGE